MSESARFNTTYADYNKVLRTWFVAFGIGVPAALLLDKDARELLHTSCSTELIIYSLVIGTAIQIFLAFLNKYIAWCNSYIILNDESEEKDKVEVNELIEWIANLTEKIWIDVVGDIVTIVLFGIAILSLYRLFL